MNLELMSWSEAAGAQVLQVTLVAVVVAILVRIFARSRPHLAYLLWMVVILKCLTPPLAASRTSVFSWVLAERPELEVSEPPLEPLTKRKADPPRDRFPLEQMPGIVPLEIETASTPVETKRIEAIDPPSFSTEAILFGLWAIGGFVLCCYVGLKWVRFRNRVRRTAVSAPDWLHTEVGQLSVSLGLRREPRIMLCEAPLGPLSMGLLRPTVVLPAALVDQARADALKPILAHELMHLRRGDVALGYGQLLAQILWWFHPLVWWANREARRERERCCDEAVLARLTLSPANYARTLIDVLDTKHNMQAGTLLPIASASDVNDQRLRHIMRPAATFHRSTPRWCWFALIVAAALFLPGAGLSLEPERTEAVSEAEADGASTPADDTGELSEPTAEAQPAETESQVPQFSPKHEVAAKRLQELGAEYLASVNTETKLPYVGVSIGQGWKGNQEDWQLLADLDMLSSINIRIDQEQANGLNVLASIDRINTLTISPPTIEVIEKISAIPNLTNLHLADWREKKVEMMGNVFAPIAKLSNLGSLFVADVLIDREAMQIIGELKGLTSLSLQNTSVSDDGIAQLAGHPSLESIQVIEHSPDEGEIDEGLSGSGFGRLAGLSSLRWLDLTIPTIDDEGLAGVAQLQTLERLIIGNASGITSAGITTIGGMKGLKKLLISGSGLVGDDFAGLALLESLENLVLSEADLGDRGVVHIAALSNLQQLEFPGKGLTERGLQVLGNHTQLRSLCLRDAQLNTNDLELLEGLQDLEFLQFDTRRLDDDSVVSLRGLQGLTRVSLNGARITDIGLAALVYDDRYEHLHLDHTEVTDLGMKSLKRLKNLRTLSLVGTEISNAGLKDLQRLTQLWSLNVRETNVTESGVKQLARMLPNLHITPDFKNPYFYAAIELIPVDFGRFYDEF